MSLLDISRQLAADLETLSFGPPVAYVYNPLIYAREPWEQYLERYANGRPEVVMTGMNPGPFGMAQTGVPFGAVSPVRDWLGIEAPVTSDQPQHPKRPISGFDCPRDEVSGMRVWGWAQSRFGTPERFFERFFIYNYCPLLFLEEGGRNLTPDKIKIDQRKPLLELCQRSFRQAVELLQPRLLVAFGVWAEKQARQATEGLDIEVGRILHPSPASPLANRGWAEQAEKQLTALGIELPAADA